MGFQHIGQASLKLLTSGDPSASASQSAGITGVSHHAQPRVGINVYLLSDQLFKCELLYQKEEGKPIFLMLIN